jgi:hypothetical protein
MDEGNSELTRLRNEANQADHAVHDGVMRSSSTQARTSPKRQLAHDPRISRGRESYASERLLEVALHGGGIADVCLVWVSAGVA